MLTVSSETDNKLITGEFKTFDKLDSFNRTNSLEELNIQVLYWEVFNENRADYTYVIETIFINE